MEYTEKNTENATHYNPAINSFYINPDKHDCMYMGKDFGQFEPNGGTSAYQIEDLIELSRPVGERREDFEMNELKIPVNWLKEKGIELAVGDDYYNSSQNCNGEAGDIVLSRVNINRENLSNDHLFITSFADRRHPNGQPVADDFRVSISCYDGSLLHGNADQLEWGSSVESWTLDFNALHKIYLSEQETNMNEQRCGKDTHHVELQGEADHLLDIVIKPDVDPVFTQAQADAGELPSAGCEVKLTHNGILGSFISGVVLAYDENKEAVILKCAVMPDNYPEDSKINDVGIVVVYGTNDKDFMFLPIDNRTDEEKLRDAITDVLPSDMGTAHADKLMNSNKFTITLNED